MKKLIVLLSVSLVIINSAICQTIIPNGTEASGTWTKINSPYIIDGEVTIPQNLTLTIEPGVTIKLKTGTNFDYDSGNFDAGMIYVKGNIIAKGTKTDSITFTRNGSSGNWGILFLEGNSPDSSKIAHCKILYASKIRKLNNGNYEQKGSITTIGKTVYINNCSITNHYYNGIQLQSANANISKNKIKFNGENGIYLYSSSNAEIVNNRISNNTKNGIYSYFENSMFIFGNIIDQNEYGIHEYYEQSSLIYNNTIYGNTKVGIYKICHFTTEKITKCINNIIEKNGINITSNDGALYKNIQVLYVQNCLVNDLSFNSDIFDNGGNILGKTASFIDTISFKLNPNSAAINTGTLDLSDDNQITIYDIYENTRIQHDSIDIGAFEFQDDFLSILEPTKFEYLQIGKEENITWKSNASGIKIEYSSNSGNSWNIITSNTANNGEYKWIVPEIASGNYLLKLSDNSNELLFDTISVQIANKNFIGHKEVIYGTWTNEESPYIILGEAIIPNGKSLIIEPGVEVKIASGTKTSYQLPYEFEIGIIHVKGELKALGTNQDSIYFSRYETTGEWSCIWLDETKDTCIFDFCRFEHNKQISVYPSSNTVDNFGGAITSRKSVAKISNCNFTNNYAAFDIFNSYSLFENNTVDKNQGGLLLVWSKQEIVNNIISNNDYGIVCQSNAIISKNKINSNNKGIWVIDSRPLIQGNEIMNNLQYGINGTESGDYLNGFCIVDANKIYNNLRGVNFYSKGAPKLTNNLIFDNETGVSLYNQYFSDIYNNTITQNEIGLINSSINTKFKNNILYDNQTSFEFESPITASNNLTQDSIFLFEVIDEGENIIADPLFNDTLNNDFSLLAGSICINSGTLDTTGLCLPENDFAGNSRISNGRIDIGAYEFNDNADFVRIYDPYKHKYLVSNLFYELKWNLNDSLSDVRLIYSTNKGSSWQNIIENTENDGAYNWKVPEIFADSCMWAIIDNNNPEISDTSTYFFTISPNIIPNDCEVYGTLKEIHSPYQILGKMIVPEDSTLTIEPGTVLKMKTGDDFDEDYRFDDKSNVGSIFVFGNLIADGEKNNKIEFIGSENTGKWGSVVLNSESNINSSFNYCLFENAYKISTIIGNTVYSNESALNVYTDSVNIRNCKIINSYSGIYVSYKAEGTFITNCLITNNSNNGIDGYRGVINNCTISNNGGTGISGLFEIRNSIIYYNSESVVNPFNHNSGNDAKIGFSIIEEEQIPSNYIDSTGNIYNIPPQFVHAQNENYHLSPNSPCIDKGNPKTDFSNEPAPNGGRINMGAYGNTDEAASFLPQPRIDFMTVYQSSILGNDTITITGKYFLSDIGEGELKFGNIETPEYLSWNDSVIVCIIPSHSAEKTDLKITNSDGLTGTRTSIFTFFNPLITKVEDQYGSTSGGKQIDIYGQHFGKEIFNSLIYLGEIQVENVVSWSDSLITLIIPENSQGLKEMQFNSGEFSHNIPDVFLYTDKNIVTICGETFGTWNSANIYILECDVTVPLNKELIIEPGVLILANINSEPLSFTINGSLEINGNENDSVTVNSLPEYSGNWNGIIVNKKARINSANIKNAINGIVVKTPDFELNNSTLSNNKNSGIYFDGDENIASGTVKNSEFKYNSTGIICDAYCYDIGGSASPIIENNKILFNEADGIFCRASGSVPYSWTAISRTSTASPKINGNIFYKNNGYAISCYAIEREAQSITGSTMRRTGHTNPQITNNIIHENLNAVSSKKSGNKSNADLEILNSVFYNSDVIYSFNSKISFINSIIGPSAPMVNTEYNGFVSFKYCNVQNQAGNNIESNPQFVNPENGNFQLSQNSPCIDAGNNDYVDFENDFDNKIRIVDGNGDENEVVDIGAFEYDSYISAIRYHDDLLQIKVYPNPTKGIIQVDGIRYNTKTELAIFNMTGKLLFKKYVSGNSTINLSELVPGIYFLSVNGQKNRTFKIIKN